MNSRQSQPAIEELLFNLSAYAVTDDSLFRSTDVETLLAIALVGRFRTLVNLSYTDNALYGLAIQGVVTHISSALQRLGYISSPDAVQCVSASELSVWGTGALTQECTYSSAAGERDQGVFGFTVGGGDATGAPAALPSPGCGFTPVLLVHNLHAIEFTENAIYRFADALRAVPGPLVAVCTTEELPYPLVELFDLSFNCLSDEIALPVPCLRKSAAGAYQPSWGSFRPERVGVSLGLQNALTAFLLRLAEVHLTTVVGDEEVISEGPRLMVEGPIMRFARCRAALDGRQFCEPQDLALGILCAIPHQLRLMPVLRKAELPAVTKKLVHRKTCRQLEELLKAWF